MAARTVGMFVLASFALHATALVQLPARLDAPPREQGSHVEVSLVTEAPRPAPPPAAAPEPQPTTTERTAVRKPRPIPQRAAPVAATLPDRTQPPPSAAPAPAVQAALISPLQVARLAVERGLGTPMAPPPAADTFDEALHTEAAYRADLQPRAAPKLQRRSDGSYVWKSDVLSATIAADGSVQFKDAPLFSFDDFARQSNAEDSPTAHLAVAPGTSRFPQARGGVRFRFDVVDLVERALGLPQYAAERRWFLEQTAELRERMTMRQRLCSSTDQRPLREYLANAALHDGVDVAAAHDAIFAAFDACAGSSFGPAAVHTIITFVRDHLPEGSARAYDAPDLARLNAHRDRNRRFEPYARE